MRTQTLISSMVGIAAAVAVAGSANAGFVDNFTRSLANASPNSQNNNTITVTNTGAGNGMSRANTGLTNTAFPNPKRYTSVMNKDSSATMTGNGSAAFVLGRATSGGASAMGPFGQMSLTYLNNGLFADLTGTTSFSINVGSYTGGATTWTLNVNFDSQSEVDSGSLQLILTNSNIVSGVLTFNVANMDPFGTINWAKVGSIGLGVKRAEWGDANSTVGFTLSDFQYNVPAPGAAALVGLAGLVASRRRRN